MYYQVTLSQPGYLAVNFKHASNGSGGDYWHIHLLNADGSAQHLFVTIAGTATDRTKYVGLPAGNYLVRVTRGTYHQDNRDYTLTLSATTGDYELERNDTVEDATQLTLGTVVTGNLEALQNDTDVDYYKFTLAQPGHVALNFKHASNGGGGDYWHIHLQSADGSAQHLFVPIAGYITDKTKYVGLPAGNFLVRVTRGYNYADDRDYALTVSATTGNYEREGNDTVQDATQLTLGTAVTGNLEILENNTDVDYYKFNLAEPGYVALNFKHASNGGGSNYWHIHLQSADGSAQHLFLPIAGSTTDKTKYVGLPAGNYLVRVTRGYNYADDRDYALTVSATTGVYEREGNDTVQGATQLTLGTAVTGNLEVLENNTDVDYYKFTLAQPSYLAVNFKHASNGIGGIFWHVTVQSADGNTNHLFFDSAGTTSDRTKYVGLPAGSYLVRVTRGYNNADDRDYALTVSASTGDYEREGNDTVQDATELTLGTAVTGNLEVLENDTDVDYYKFTLAQPGHVALNFKHAANGSSGNFWHIHLQSADGSAQHLFVPIAGSTTDKTKYVGLPAGNYLVRVTRGYNYADDRDYALTVSATTGVYEREGNDTVEGATQLTLGTAVTGNLDVLENNTDVDYYKFTLAQPGYVALNFKHQSNGIGGNFWHIHLQSADGSAQHLFVPIAGSTTDKTKYVGLPAGNYLVRVTRGYNDADDRDYALTVSATTGNYEQEGNDTVQSATQLTLGTAVTGNLEVLENDTDVDYYKFTLAQPGHVALNFQHAANGSSGNFWHIHLQSADGSAQHLFLPIAGSTTDKTKYVGLPAGNYLVRVTRGYNYADDRDYALTVSATTGVYERERNDTVEGATQLTLGTAVTGNLGVLENNNDVDYYKFALAQPGYVALNFKHQSNGIGSNFWHIHLQSADGAANHLFVPIAGSTADKTKYVGLPAGNFLVRVTRGYNDADDRDYALTISATPGAFEQEGNDTVEDANQLTLGTLYTGNLEALEYGEDVDFYQFTIARPGTMGLHFKHASNNNGSIFWRMTLQSADGQSEPLETSIAGSAAEVSKYFDLAAGTYSVKVNRGPNDATDLDYSVAVSDATPPVVTAFAVPALSNHLEVAISAFSAADNVAVTAFLVTESATAPAATAVGWTSTAPASYSFATPGPKTLYAWTRDAAGNVSASKSAAVTVDTTAPTVTLFSMPTHSNSLTVAITKLVATDNVALAQYLVSESATAPAASANGWSATPPASFSFLSTGSKTIYAWAKDTAGNVSLGKPATVIVDTTAPTVTVLTVPAYSKTLAVAIGALNATDNVAVAGYLVSEAATAPAASAPGWSASAPDSFSCATAGSKTLYAWAKDAAGNVSPGKQATVIIDTTAPAVNVFTVPAASNTLTIAISSISATDDVAMAKYLISESATPPAASASLWSAAVPTSYSFDTAGNKILYAWAMDAAGNISAPKSASVTIDTPPAVAVFTVAPTSVSLTVAITALSASDNLAVTGYLVTESAQVPAAAAAGWDATAPASYIFTSTGTHTLYAFAKDAAGNVSAPVSASVTISFPLTIETAGTGSGTVNSDPAGIACATGSSAGCSANFNGGSVTLVATPSAGSTFDGWSDICSGPGACSVVLDAGKTVTATFGLAPPVMLEGTSYSDLQAAYDDAPDGSIIKMKEGLFTGSLTANRRVRVTIEGGYNAEYDAVVGNTVVRGMLLLRNGSVVTGKVNVR